MGFFSLFVFLLRPDSTQLYWFLFAALFLVFIVFFFRIFTNWHDRRFYLKRSTHTHNMYIPRTLNAVRKQSVSILHRLSAGCTLCPDCRCWVFLRLFFFTVNPARTVIKKQQQSIALHQFKCYLLVLCLLM